MAKYTMTKKNRLRLSQVLVGGLVAGTTLLTDNLVYAADSSNSGLLGDVTVTARRRNESLQDVPIAISVIGGDDWSDKGAETIKSLQFDVPNTTMNLSNPRQTQTAIRGLGMNPAGNGLSSSVGYYLDGVYLDRPGMAAVDLYDLQQIEVLKGPQGTLFGKNTTAGALNIQTAKPTFKQEIKGETTFGSYDTREFRAVLNSPIGDNNVVAVRATLYQDSHASYLQEKNLLTHGDSPNDKNRTGARLQFLVQPSEDLSILWRNDYAIENDRDGASVLYSHGGKWYSNNNTGDLNAVAGPNYYTDGNASQNMMTRNYGTSVEVNKDLGSGYKLTSISAFRDYMFRPRNNGLYMANASGVAGSYYSSQAREKELEATQEIRFASPVGGKVDYVVGAYYLWRREGTNQVVNYPSNWHTLIGKNSSPLDSAYLITDSDPTTNSYALFAQSNYHFDDQLTLTTGLRETFEENSARIRQYAVSASAPYSDYYGVEGTRVNSINELVTLSDKVNKNLLTYVTLSHGSKANGFNNSVPNDGTNYLPTSVNLVKPEVAYNAELGVKTTLPDQHLTVNADLFYTKVFDYQSNTKVIYNSNYVSLIQNTGAVLTKGLEVDLAWKPNTNWKYTFNGAYDLATYKSYRAAPAIQGSSASTQDLTGQPLLNAPKYSFATAVTYTRPITDDVVAYATASYSWKDWQYGYVDDSSYSIIHQYGVTNLRLGTNFDDRYDVAFFIDNVFNTHYFFSTGTASTGYGYTAAPGSPQVYGLTARVKF